MGFKKWSVKKRKCSLFFNPTRIPYLESSHKELNGKLQTKITDTENEIALLKGIGNNSPEMRDLKKDNKYLAEKVEAYREQLRKAGL